MNATLLFKLFLHLHDHMHHLPILHIMMQHHNMSYIMIKAIHESIHSSLPILLNISLNHSKCHLNKVLINTICTLIQILQPYIQFYIIMARHKSSFQKGFHLILSINYQLASYNSSYSLSLSDPTTQ